MMQSSHCLLDGCEGAGSLIPEDVGKAMGQILQPQAFDATQSVLIAFLAGPQPVVGYGLAEVMDGVAADIGRKPVQ